MRSTLPYRRMCVGIASYRVSRFQAPGLSAIGQHPTRSGKIKKKKEEKLDPSSVSPLQLPAHTHTPFFRSTLASFRVLGNHPTPYTLHHTHPSPLFRLTYYRSLRYVPSTYPLLLNSKFPSVRFRKFSRSSLFARVCFSLGAPIGNVFFAVEL